MHPLLDRCSNFKAISFAPGPMWSFAPFAVDVVARRPTYTCPNPPFPSFLSTMYVGDPPTCVCVVRWFFRKKKRRITKVRERVRSDFKRHSSRRNSFARLWTTNDENTHAIRVSSFYQKRKNDDALKVVLPSPELARSRRRRRPPRSRDRCPSFFVRRPLLYFDVATNSTTTTTFRRRALLVEERTRKEKGRESPAVLLSRDDAFLGAAAAVERKEGKK